MRAYHFPCDLTRMYVSIVMQHCLSLLVPNCVNIKSCAWWLDGDLLIVRELRKLSNEARRATRIAARTADESLKWLDWPQFLNARPLCQTLLIRAASVRAGASSGTAYAPSWLLKNLVCELGRNSTFYMLIDTWQSDVTIPQVVSELRSECAALDSQGRKRTGAAVAWSLQRYLIFALLSCIPGAP